MDSNAYLFNHSTLQSVYYQDMEENGMIDLGLSLKALQPSGHEWEEATSELKNSNNGFQNLLQQVCDEEIEKWVYVKVNMDQVAVGRKVCIVHNRGYSTLARQLEDMFGRHCPSGLNLFHVESEFSLFFKDNEENWRNVNDVPWREFVKCVRRLRIAKIEDLVRTCSSSYN